MEIFTEIYSFRLNVVRDTNVVRDNLSNFYGEQIEFITKICLLHWVLGYLENINCLLVFEAATSCNISKCLSKCHTRHKLNHHPIQLTFQG